MYFSCFCKRVDLSLKNNVPWLVLAGSGGMADFLSDVLENLSSLPVVQSSNEGEGEAAPSVDLKDRVAERVKKYFPSEVETDKLVERVRSIHRDMCNYHAVTDTQNRKRNVRGISFPCIFSSWCEVVLFWLGSLQIIFMVSEVFKCSKLQFDLLQDISDC